MTWGQLLGLFGGTALIVAGVTAFVTKLVTERALSKWRRDEQRQLETLKHALSESQTLFEAAIASHASGQDLFQARRLAAVDGLWQAALLIRDQLSMPVLFFTLLLPSEYDEALAAGGPCHDIIESIAPDKTQAVLEAAKAVERERPHVGDTLWLIFFIYRAVHGRLNFLIDRGRQKGHIDDWRDDSGLRQLFSAVLDEPTIADLYRAGNDLLAIRRGIDVLESMLLREIALIASGRQSSIESFENARQMRDAVRALDHG